MYVSIFFEVVAQLGERGSVTAKEAGSKPVNLAAKCENILHKEIFFHTCETQIKGWVPKRIKGGACKVPMRGFDSHRAPFGNAT